MNRIVIVDQNDSVVGNKERDSLDPGDIYRVSSLWITNSQGDILMAMRSKNKKHDPGTWGPAVAGTVDEGETYDDNIVKETFEEIGLSLSIADLRKGPKILTHGRKNPFFNQWYFYTTDKPINEFVLEEDEVESLHWMPRQELLARLEKNPSEFIKTLPSWIGPVLAF